MLQDCGSMSPKASFIFYTDFVMIKNDIVYIYIYIALDLSASK